MILIYELGVVIANLFPHQVVHSRRETDSGIYYCTARNKFGTVRSRNATLQVAGKAQRQPMFINSLINTTSSLHPCSASGLPTGTGEHTCGPW